MDRPALAAGAAPGVADPPETVAAVSVGEVAQPDGPHRYVVHTISRDRVNITWEEPHGNLPPNPGAVVRQECGEWYVWRDCGFATGYCESQAQASRIAAHHSLEAHGF